MAQSAVELARYADLEVFRTGQLRVIFTGAKIAAYEFCVNAVETAFPHRHVRRRLDDLAEVPLLPCPLLECAVLCASGLCGLFAFYTNFFCPFICCHECNADR